MTKHLAGVYVSNILLLGFSAAWLILIFIPLLIASDHSMGLWYENNLAILIMEAGICIFGITWSGSRIFFYMRRAMVKLRREQKLRREALCQNTD